MTLKATSGGNESSEPATVGDYVITRASDDAESDMAMKKQSTEVREDQGMPDEWRLVAVQWLELLTCGKSS